MTLSEIRIALQLLTELSEKSAARVMDVTLQDVSSDAGYEFIGFASRKNVLVKNPPSDQEEITKLLDELHSELAKRIAGKNVTLWWRLKPELIMSANGFRIGCRLKTTPAIVLPKLVVANG